MIELGYQLSSEEHPAPDLVGYARRAEEVGFSYAVISDHFHPWSHRQGQSPFVWSVLGAIAQRPSGFASGR
jgi:coenzyme F420-dependent glucose-6-phosphate dehydrogenase